MIFHFRFQLEVIGLNRQDYETRRVLLTLKVLPKEKMARHEVEFKIDNLNVEDLLDEHRYILYSFLFAKCTARLISYFIYNICLIFFCILICFYAKFNSY